MIAGDQFGIGGYNSINRGNTSDTNVAFIKNPFQKQLDSPANIPTGSGLIDKSLNQMQKAQKQKYDVLRDTGTWSEEKYQKEMKRLLGDKDLSSSKVYSDMNPSSLGATEGSLLAMGDTRGIKTPAPETKVTETKRMAGGFFSPQNFQRSGVPDATIMTREQMGQALTGDPGYTRFGSLDRPGTQAAKDTAAFNEAYKRSFFAPRETDARSIAERREANEQSIRDTAKADYQAFKDRGGRPAPTTKISGDDTYGTNVMSNPAFGFRSKMSDENKARYDSSATEASRRAEVEPSKGNLVMSVTNAMKRGLNTVIGADQGTPLTREVALEKRGEAEQRRYEKYLNRPMYQREATARVEAGITPQMTKERNQAQMRADAAARDKEFQSNKRAKAVEKASKRVKENTGTGRDGTFGAGTVGQGMPSNPNFRGPGNNKGFKKSDSSETKNTPAKAVKKANTAKSGSKKASRGARGSTSSRSKGGTGKSGSGSKSNTGSKKSSRGAKGSAGSRSKGGTGTGGTKTSRKASKASRSRTGRSRTRCDIRCKFDIKPLTEMNLIMDDLAEVAYFVKQIQK